MDICGHCGKSYWWIRGRAACPSCKAKLPPLRPIIPVKGTDGKPYRGI